MMHFYSHVLQAPQKLTFSKHAQEKARVNTSVLDDVRTRSCKIIVNTSDCFSGEPKML